MNYNTLRNKPTINYKEIIGDNTVTDVGGITEEEFDDLLDTDLASYYTKAQIDELFSRSFVYREKSGSIVTFDCPESTTSGISEVTAEIVAIQAGNGDPSPTNVRPISGWSAVNVVVSTTTDSEDGTTYTTQLKDGQGNPITCYGGQLVNENGVQRLDNTDACDDIGSLGVTYRTDTAKPIFQMVLSKLADETIYSTATNASSSCYKLTNSTNVSQEGYNGYFAISADGTRAYIQDLDYTDATLFKTARTGQKIKYKLATPEEIPQDNLAIASQDGTNNLWADSGDITVKALDKIIQG